MAYELLISLIVIFTVGISAESLVQHTNPFLHPDSAVNSKVDVQDASNGAAQFAHGRFHLGEPQNSLTQTGHNIKHLQQSTQKDSAANGSNPSDIGKEAPGPTSTVHILKPTVVMLIITMISSATIALVRCCICRKSVAMGNPSIRENEPRPIEMERVGPKSPSNKENESRPTEINGVSRQMPLFEPANIAPNFALTCCTCNFELCGLSP